MHFTGERLTTDVKGKTAIEHLHRYAITLRWLQGKHVLDIASGEGYGSQLMATVADQVTGVDVSEEAVRHAQKNYHRKNLNFLHGSATHIPLADKSIDIVVSFETIEHLREHDQMLTEIRRVLKPGGTLIISSPDKRFYSDQPGHRNDFHLRELYQEEFEQLLLSHFPFCEFFLQGFVIGSLVQGGQPSSYITQYSGTFEEIRTKDHADHTYNLAVCSDAPLKITFHGSVFNDEKMFLAIEEYFKARIQSIYDSKSYRLGNFFVALYRKLTRRK